MGTEVAWALFLHADQFPTTTTTGWGDKSLYHRCLIHGWTTILLVALWNSNPRETQGRWSWRAKYRNSFWTTPCPILNRWRHRPSVLTRRFLCTVLSRTDPTRKAHISRLRSPPRLSQVIAPLSTNEKGTGTLKHTQCSYIASSAERKPRSLP